jgi:riboflavin synthase
MFTGIVEARGKVIQVEPRGRAIQLTLEIPPGLTGMNLGDSISVSGACLTVVDQREDRIVVDVSQETLEHTLLGEVRAGDSVNLERPLRLSDRLGGHIVTGHVDGIGIVTEIGREGEFIRARIRIPGNLSQYVVERGSIAIDGISLTVNGCRGNEIQLTLIPFTLQKTTLLGKRRGDRVNVETDLLAKYVERLLDPKRKAGEVLDRDFLEKHGFLKE